VSTTAEEVLKDLDRPQYADEEQDLPSDALPSVDSHVTSSSACRWMLGSFHPRFDGSCCI